MYRRSLLALAIVAALALAAPVGAQTDETTTSEQDPLTIERELVEPFQIVFPVLSTDTVFTDSYGNPRSEGRSHKGNDLLMERGTPVASIADGRITRITKGTRAGFYVVVDHGNGYTSWYMHLNNDTSGTDDGRGGAATAFAPELTVGSPVAAGQVIGFVGDSGNAEGTTPHVHFELRLNGKALDPYRDLVAAMERYQLETQIEEGDTPFK